MKAAIKIVAPFSKKKRTSKHAWLTSRIGKSSKNAQEKILHFKCPKDDQSKLVRD